MSFRPFFPEDGTHEAPGTSSETSTIILASSQPDFLPSQRKMFHYLSILKSSSTVQQHENVLFNLSKKVPLRKPELLLELVMGSSSLKEEKYSSKEPLKEPLRNI